MRSASPARASLCLLAALSVGAAALVPCAPDPDAAVRIAAGERSPAPAGDGEAGAEVAELRAPCPCGCCAQRPEATGTPVAVGWALLRATPAALPLPGARALPPIRVEASRGFAPAPDRVPLSA